jgi:hypothetical protein
VVDVGGFGKRSCGQGSLERGERNRNGQPHRKLPPDRSTHCDFPSSFNGHVSYFVDPSDRNELGACRRPDISCLCERNISGGRDEVLVSLAVFEPSLLKPYQKVGERALNPQRERRGPSRFAVARSPRLQDGTLLKNMTGTAFR